jgi:hypothetical protein
MKKTIILWIMPIIMLSALSVRAGKGSAAMISGQVQPTQEEQVISTCKARVNIPQSELNWLYVPQNASNLHTELPYAFLAGQLISNHAVDGASCPAGGLALNGYANACGLALAQPLVIKLQNSFDQAILDAWTETGVPPVMIKQMIRYESQFWPGRFGLYHYGLAHLTYSGVQMALTRNTTLYRQLCSVTASCNGVIDGPEVSAFLNLMDASCPTCQDKIDLTKAQKSILYLSEAVYSHCEQTAQIIYNATKIMSSYVVDYPTIWKLTLMNYNVGPTCVFNSISAAFDYRRGKVSWSDIQLFTKDAQCSRGVVYANQITEKFYNFPTQ